MPMIAAIPALDRVRRKARKLARDPQAFLRDSSLMSAVARIGSTVGISLRRRALASAALTAAATPVPGAGPVPLASQLSGHTNPDGSRAYRILGQFAAGKLSLADSKPHDRGWASLLFIREDQVETYAPLLETLIATERFAPLAPRNLALVMVSPAAASSSSTDTAAIAILDGLDAATRNRCARFQNFVFLGDHGALPTALRSIHPSTRVVQVAPDDLPVDCTADETDILITSNRTAPAGNWRRLHFCTSDISAVAAALGRALQEAGPKALNILLPAWGACQHDPTLLSYEADRFEAVIDLAPSTFTPQSADRPASSRTFKTWTLEVLAPGLRAVHLSEAALWRYRTQVDAAHDAASWSELIALMLADGARIDVRAAR